MQASRYHGIQALRFVAAAMVLVCHATHGKLAAGAAGVDVFFVISGFIMAQVSVGREPGEFIRDRLVRIFPSYWLALLPWLLIAAGAGLVTAPRLWASLTLWPMWDDRLWRSYLKLSWTLSFELLFYAGVALVLWRRWLLWPLLAAYGLAMAGAYLTKAPALVFLGNPLALEFGAGVLLAQLPKVGWRWGIAALAIGAAAFGWFLVQGAEGLDNALLFSLIGPERVMLWGLPAALLVFGAVQIEQLVSPAWRPLVALGDASYSLYLWHLIVLEFVPGLLGVIAALLLSLAIYRYVEKPMLRFLRQPKPLVLAPAE